MYGIGISSISWRNAILMIAGDNEMDELLRGRSESRQVKMLEEAHATLLLRVRRHIYLDGLPASYIFFITAHQWRAWVESRLNNFKSYYGGAIPTSRQLASDWCKFVRREWEDWGKGWNVLQGVEEDDEGGNAHGG